MNTVVADVRGYASPRPTGPRCRPKSGSGRWPFRRKAAPTWRPPSKLPAIRCRRTCPPMNCAAHGSEELGSGGGGKGGGQDSSGATPSRPEASCDECYGTDGI